MHTLYGNVYLEPIAIIENVCSINYQDWGWSIFLSEQWVLYSVFFVFVCLDFAMHFLNRSIVGSLEQCISSRGTYQDGSVNLGLFLSPCKRIRVSILSTARKVRAVCRHRQVTGAIDLHADTRIVFQLDQTWQNQVGIITRVVLQVSDFGHFNFSIKIWTPQLLYSYNSWLLRPLHITCSAFIADVSCICTQPSG